MTALLVSTGAGLGHAAPFDAEYVFGDSLSDNGNLTAGLHTTFPNPPSYNNSFTNGPVALQLVAQSYGLALNPSLWTTGVPTSGTNFAVAGATSAPISGAAAPIDLSTQVAAFRTTIPAGADPNALYVVMIGGNDVRRAAAGPATTAGAAVTAGVNAELSALTALASFGARNFLVVNVPDVGAIPESVARNDAAAATALSQAYDAQLATGINGLSLPGARVTQFDLLSFNRNLVANAASYGFTDKTDPCYTNTPLSAATTPACGPNAANIGSFVYWDAIHPTAGVHALWAQGIEASLATAVPEPASLGLLATLLLAVGGSGLATRRARA